MRTVRAAKGVVDIHVAQLGQLLRKGGVIRFFFCVEAQIFQQQHLTGFQLARQLLGGLAYAIRREADVDFLTETFVDHGAQLVDDGAQAHLGVRLALRTAQMRSQNQFRFMPQRVLDRRQGLADARVVGDDGAVFRERNVEVHAKKDVLVFERDVTNRKFRHRDCVPLS